MKTQAVGPLSCALTRCAGQPLNNSAPAPQTHVLRWEKTIFVYAELKQESIVCEEEKARGTFLVWTDRKVKTQKTCVGGGSRARMTLGQTIFPWGFLSQLSLSWIFKMKSSVSKSK